MKREMGGPVVIVAERGDRFWIVRDFQWVYVKKFYKNV
jgi:hypothetical protein